MPKGPKKHFPFKMPPKIYQNIFGMKIWDFGMRI
jgi:hypothetical protein